MRRLWSDFLLEIAEFRVAAQKRENERVTLVGRAQLALEVLDMHPNRIRADVECKSNLLFGVPMTGQNEAITLAPRERLAALGRCLSSCRLT